MHAFAPQLRLYGRVACAGAPIEQRWFRQSRLPRWRSQLLNERSKQVPNAAKVLLQSRVHSETLARSQISFGKAS
jgi:hypothetical protein